MGPCGPIWVARGEKHNVGKVKIIISDGDFFLGLCLVDGGGGGPGLEGPRRKGRRNPQPVQEGIMMTAESGQGNGRNSAPEKTLPTWCNVRPLWRELWPFNFSANIYIC